MAPVRTKQLAVFAGLSAFPTLVFTAPPGKTTVVEMISATTGLNAPLTYWSITHVPTGARIAGASHSSGTTDFTCDLLIGKWVLNPGDELTFSSDGSTYDLVLGGYELDLP